MRCLPTLSFAFTLVLLIAAAVLALCPPAEAAQKEPKRDAIPVQVPVAPGTGRAWVLLAGSVPAERGNFRHDLLAGVELDAKKMEAMRTFLELKWQVKRRVDLVNRLDDLQENGRRVALKKLMGDLRKLKLTEETIDAVWTGQQREQMRALLRNAARIDKEKEGLLAWDLVECIVLIRQGFAAGYMDEAESWRRLEILGKRLQKAYASFEDVGEIWCIGTEIDLDAESTSARTALKKLKSDEKSPWRTTAWDVRIAKLETPPPAVPAPAKPGTAEPGEKRP